MVDPGFNRKERKGHKVNPAGMTENELSDYNL